MLLSGSTDYGGAQNHIRPDRAYPRPDKTYPCPDKAYPRPERGGQSLPELTSPNREVHMGESPYKRGAVYDMVPEFRQPPRGKSTQPIREGEGGRKSVPRESEGGRKAKPKKDRPINEGKTKPILDPLIALMKPRSELALFLQMRGVKRRDVDTVMQRAIDRYNASHPSRPYRPADREDQERHREDATKACHAAPRIVAGPPETSAQAMYPARSEADTRAAKATANKKFGREADAKRRAIQKKQRKAMGETDARLQQRLVRLESERAQVAMILEEREKAALQIQQSGRALVARRRLEAKRAEKMAAVKARRTAAAIKIQGLQRGRASRARMNEVRSQLSSKGSAQASLQPQSVPEQRRMEEAALKLQALARGRSGRKEARRRVKPFSFSCRGHNFQHAGRRKSVDGMVLQYPTRDREDKPHRRGSKVYNKPWLKNAKKTQAEAKKKQVQAQEVRDNDPWASLLNERDEEAQARYHRNHSYLSDETSDDLEVFHIFDRDGDGCVSRDDFDKSVHLLGKEGGAEGGDLMMRIQNYYDHFESLWNEMDSDNDGYVSKEEFIEFLRASRMEERKKKRQDHMHGQMTEKRRRALLIARLKGRLDAKSPYAEQLADTLQFREPKKKKSHSDDPRINAYARD